MTTPLPESLTYGFVACRVVTAVGDTPYDTDRYPNAIGSTGTVRFTPTIGSRVTLDHTPTLVDLGTPELKLAADGTMVDATGTPGVWLVTGRYTVQITTTTYKWPPFSIDVTDQHTETAPLWLPPRVSTPIPPNTPVVVLEVPPGGDPHSTLVRLPDGSLAWGAVPAGPAGPVPQITFDAEPLPPGDQPYAEQSGPPEAPYVMLGIPKGDPGNPGPVPTVTFQAPTMLAAGSTPTVTQGGTPAAPTVKYGIPYPTGGHGSGLDADTVDGKHAADFLAAAIPDLGAADLNTITTNGRYRQGSSANATPAANYPVALAGYLEVNAMTTASLMQRYTPADLTASAAAQYVRTCYGGTWSPWREWRRSGAPGGPDLTGTGSPEGVVTAPVGVYYTDTASTNGARRWYKASGTGTTGWIVTEGDTGWRRSSGVITDTVGNVLDTNCYAGGIDLRRINNVVHWRLGFLSTTIKAGPVRPFADLLPTGFRADLAGKAYTAARDGFASPVQVEWSGAAFYVWVQGAASATQVLNGQGQLTTKDAWPGILPYAAV